MPDRAVLCCLIATFFLVGADSRIANAATAAEGTAIAETPLHNGLPAGVLVKTSLIELTRADFDAAIARVPEGLRFEFTASPKRLQELLNNMLVTKTLATQARIHGTKPSNPVLAAGAADDSDRTLAAAEMARIESDAAKEFDARRPTFEAKAQEVFALDRERYLIPEEIRISDIAIAIKGRGEEAALTRAREARQRVVGGVDFATVAREYSDDPTTRDKGGALPFVPAKGLAPDYAKAVFALSSVGEISEPIKAPSAYHVVRLEERRPAHTRPFEEVRESILATMKQRFVADQRDLRIKSIYNDPQLRVNQAAIDALVTNIDPALLKPPSRSKSRGSASK